MGSSLQQQDIRVILDALAPAGGHRKQTATRLGISPRRLAFKLALRLGGSIQISAP
ncbi:helix-turn-helix domain-containing protein [Thiorhodovibrio winogradskyi]|uniref:helix-turn-helix domain-containing protein n=1 Tax=Thiorhodovibrio winogradskyi TaxID=77007 RepID=UPI002E2D92AF|nr:helix-turn-helix domain-containing protein [Thiorhodovibrio winogradskyi]